tara:strand:- start:19894 stop:23739 length:3846 start_codon:yes stop_codon:yes gene_type:complete
MAKSTAPAWERLKSLDIGELNDLNHDVHEARYDGDAGALQNLKQIFADKYSYEVASGQGPWAAVVLSVKSGPQVKNQATTDGRSPNSLDNYPYPFHKERAAANKKRAVVVRAKIPEFDVDIDWPKSVKDLARIDAHGEYFQFREDPTLEKIKVGSIIWVAFNNAKDKVAINGRPAGKIVGVHTIGVEADIVTRDSPRDSHNPKCQAARNLSAPPGGFYVGHTDPDPTEEIGAVPIRKIKGNIKTGIYGNGTPQTKAHFEAALSHPFVPKSPKHEIPGPAPDSKNAFIWIGSLKNNGYMDVLDRPLNQGRETIIYAPMTLDLNAPIEIKYYFHDKAGFGHAHLNGPGTTVKNAIEAASFDNNDFKLKIAPSIKDLNRDGRNYILVIPEMSYSRGFGTTSQASSRIKDMIAGADPGLGNSVRETIRTKVSPTVRPLVKQYLNALPVETTKNVLSITPLREREFATFDGSFSGGKFGDFHNEIIDTIEEHIGTIYDKVEYISILADGMGAIALSSITVDVLTSGPRSAGKTSFINAFMGKKLRIDFVTDADLDSIDFYGYFFGTSEKIADNGQNQLVLNSPSLSFWNNFVKVRASGVEHGYTEFNYITEPNQRENSLFNFIGKETEYASKRNSTSGIGKRNFVITAQEARTPGDQVFPNNNVFINMHVSPGENKTNYAFTMVNENEGADTFLQYPVKSDADSSVKPALHAVPDHAYTLASKPSVGDLEKIKKKQEELKPRIKEFEEIISLSLQEAEGDAVLKPICVTHPFYCKLGWFQTHASSKFFKRYTDYLTNKKDYMELAILAEEELKTIDIINDKDALLKQKNDVQKKQLASEATAQQQIGEPPGPTTYLASWDFLRSKFTYVMFDNAGTDVMYKPGHPAEGWISEVSQAVVASDAYKKLFNKLEGAIKNVTAPAVEKPADCADQPKKLGTLTERIGTVPTIGKSSGTDNNCSEISISVPNNFEDLQKMIPYYPEKSDFEFSGRESQTKTKIHEVAGFKTKTFKYPARGSTGNPAAAPKQTYKTSPPVWACISQNIQTAWKEACEASRYYPFEMVTGIRASEEPKKNGISAYQEGVSLHAYGLAIDVDPPITGYSSDGKQRLSIFTGAWTYKIMSNMNHVNKLIELGVFQTNELDILMSNALEIEGENIPRMVQDWRDAPGAYIKDRYDKIMKPAANQPIVPIDANPTLWAITFCEKTGMKWGNGLFLKKRFRGGESWTKPEKALLSDIYGVSEIVDRIQAISWNSMIEDHMHFQYWGAGSFIPWNGPKGIQKIKEKLGK